MCDVKAFDFFLSKTRRARVCYRLNGNRFADERSTPRRNLPCVPAYPRLLDAVYTRYISPRFISRATEGTRRLSLFFRKDCAGRARWIGPRSARIMSHPRGCQENTNYPLLHTLELDLLTHIPLSGRAAYPRASSVEGARDDSRERDS